MVTKSTLKSQWLNKTKIDFSLMLHIEQKGFHSDMSQSEVGELGSFLSESKNDSHG